MTNDASDAPPSTGTQTIQRAALLLRLLTAQSRTGMRLVDLHRKAGLERPTTHRILQGLVAESLVVQDPETRRYFLGPQIYEMGLAAAPRSQLRDVCHPHLKTLAALSGDTVFLTARAGLDGVCLDRLEGAFPVKVFVLEVGRRRPLGVGGGGIAILSALEAVERDRILRANAEKLARRYPRYSEERVRREIARARRRGYVLQDVVEVLGVRTLAMPIVRAQGGVVGALSVSSLARRLEGEPLAAAVAAMGRAIATIQDELAALP